MLNFHLHTAQVVGKSFKMLRVIKRIFEKLDEETVPLLFKSLICPISEYGNCVCGPMYVQRGSRYCGESVMEGYKASENTSFVLVLTSPTI